MWRVSIRVVTSYREIAALGIFIRLTRDATMNSTSPKSSLAKIGLHPKQRPIRIMVVGTRGIGKTGE